jgi:hypothetical protein
LIKGRPQRRMKPEKISFFYNRVDDLKSPMAIIKMMYDLLLAGEGHKVLGSRNSMSPNSYRQRFGDSIEENIFTTDYHKVMDAVAKLYQDHYDVNIWENGEAHDDAAKVLLKVHPTEKELDFIIKKGQLPERFLDLDFPINDDIMFGSGVGQGDSLDEEPATRALCTSGKPDSALGASQLASCKSQGYRSRDGGKSHKVGSERVKVRGKKIKGKKYGGPLPDWS